MFSCLTVHTKKKINITREGYIDDIESLRDFVLSICDNEPKKIKELINYHQHSLPKVIYSRPDKNMVRIFGIKDEGKMALNSILVNILRVGYMKISGVKYELLPSTSKKQNPSIKGGLEYLPYTNGGENLYTTLTPITVFNQKNIVVFDAIVHKYVKEKKPLSSVDKKTMDKIKEEVKVFANKVIRENIKYLLSSLVGKEKEDYGFVDNITFNWLDFKIVFARFHTSEAKMPMVIGKFESNFVLPKFVGYKIGKGFGELSHKGIQSIKSLEF